MIAKFMFLHHNFPLLVEVDLVFTEILLELFLFYYILEQLPIGAHFDICHFHRRSGGPGDPPCSGYGNIVDSILISQ